jgi:5'-nucleotidase
MAKVDLSDNSLVYVKSYGAKSYETGNSKIDIEEEGEILMKNYTGLFGLYQPDSIASYSVNGSTYLVTANEGDGREYPGKDINATYETGDMLTDEKKIKKLTLDGAIAAEYDDENDLKVMVDLGDDDNDSEYEKLYTYGARSFSIWDESGDLVWDSNDMLSNLTARYEPTLFNQDEEEMDGRSGNKGVEPEALTVGVSDGKTYAFVGLERQNVIVVYDITDPNAPIYVDYVITHRDGDISPEGMVYIPAADSPNDKNLLVVANEVSGTTTIYEFLK